MSRAKTSTVPFCNRCPHVVDFGPRIPSTFGAEVTIPTQVKLKDGQCPCDKCFHYSERKHQIEAYEAYLSRRKTVAA